MIDLDLCPVIMTSRFDDVCNMPSQPLSQSTWITWGVCTAPKYTFQSPLSPRISRGVFTGDTGQAGSNRKGDTKPALTSRGYKVCTNYKWGYESTLIRVQDKQIHEANCK